MSYIRQSLGKDEKILYEAGFHWLYWVLSWIGLGVFVLSFLYVFYGLFAGMSGGKLFMWGLLALLSAIYFLRSVIPLWVTEIAVTDHRIILKRGLIARTTDEIRLRSVEEINLKETTLGRILGYAAIEVHGTGAGDLSIAKVRNPIEFMKNIQNAAAKVKSAPIQTKTDKV